MPYQPNGVNYPNTGWNQYPYQTTPGYPFTPYYTPVQQPNAQPASYSGMQTGNPAPVRGRVVKTDAEITPSDVPMDGYASLFPTQDYSCIYVKQWDKDGKIQTTKFVPAQTDASDFTPTASFEDEMRSELADIKRMLSQRNNYKPKYHKPNNSQDGGNNA